MAIYRAETVDARFSSISHIHGNQFNTFVSEELAEPLTRIADDMRTLLHKQEQRNLLDRLPRLPNSTHDPTRGCLAGTRKTVIRRIVDWSQSDSSRSFWLQASAGTGKTAISMSLASYWEAVGCLGAACMVSGASAQGNVGRVMTTLAFQLAHNYPATSTQIGQAIADNPDVVCAPIATQFQQLIKAPLEMAITEDPKTCVILIIDAIDEIVDHERKQILAVIIRELHTLPRGVKLFITSRYGADVFTALYCLGNLCTSWDLNLAEINIIDDEVRAYILSRLAEIPNRYPAIDFPAVWPRSAHVKRLVHQACQNMLRAVDLCNFIADSETNNPMAQLNVLLDREQVNTSPLSPFDPISSGSPFMLVLPTTNSEEMSPFSITNGSSSLSSPSSFSLLSLRSTRRAYLTCTQCRRLKVKCTGDTPCGRCKRTKSSCNYPQHEVTEESVSQVYQNHRVFMNDDA